MKISKFIKGNYFIKESDIVTGKQIVENFDLFDFKLKGFSNDYILMKPNKNLSFKRIVYLYELISEDYNSILFLENTDYQTKLYEKQIAFISSDNIFIPDYILKYKAKKERYNEYNKSVQKILEYYLLENKELSTSMIINTMKMSKSVVNRANRFLSKYNLISKLSNGPMTRYYIGDRIRAIDFLLENGINPISESMYIPGDKADGKVIAKSSELALSEYTRMVEEDTTYLVSKDDFDRLKEYKINHELYDSEYIRIEKFIYDPIIIDGYINVFDLICIYKDNPDYRIKDELEKLVERIKVNNANIKGDQDI